jgi:hypothetical protein
MSGYVYHGRRMLWGLIFLSAVLCLGCGSDSTTAPPGPTSVSGNVNKAPLVGANVDIHQINADGSIGAHVAGPFVTDALGNWTGSVPAGTSGPFVLVATGGSYVDEATGNTVPLEPGRELYGILVGAASQVTPLTHATFLAMQALVAGGETLTNAIAIATSSSVTAFGYNFATTVPSDAPGASVQEKSYAALLGGLSALLNANPALSAFTNTPPIDLVIALARDMADGQLDGIDAFGNNILVPTDATGTTTAPLPALSAGNLSAWLNASTTYCTTVTDLHGITFNPNTVFNPSQPPQTGSGNVTFSGTGSALLLSLQFTPTSSQVFDGPQHNWTDAPHFVQILTVPETATTVRTAYVTYYDLINSYVWTTYNGNGIPGIVRNNGVVSFTNVALSQIQGGTTTLILNGSLTEPTVR